MDEDTDVKSPFCNILNPKLEQFELLNEAG
jgi:hypothetical protein